jgi:hypothetical protein
MGHLPRKPRTAMLHVFICCNPCLDGWTTQPCLVISSHRRWTAGSLVLNKPLPLGWLQLKADLICSLVRVHSRSGESRNKSTIRWVNIDQNSCATFFFAKTEKVIKSCVVVGHTNHVLSFFCPLYWLD